MKHRSWLLVLSLVGTLALTSCAAAGRDQQSAEIVIGEYGSLTGTTATFGISTRNGTETAVDDVNEAGGILGKKVRILVEEDQIKPVEAQTVFTKLVSKHQVIVAYVDVEI